MPLSPLAHRAKKKPDNTTLFGFLADREMWLKFILAEGDWFYHPFRVFLAFKVRLKKANLYGSKRGIPIDAQNP